MIDHIVKYISNKIIQIENIDQESSAVFEYGLSCMVEIIISMSSMLIIAIIFNQLIEGIALTIAISIFRSFGGGYHAKDFKTCYLISLVIFTLSMLFMHLIPKEVYLKVIIFFSLISFIIFIMNPQTDSQNRNLDVQEIIFFNKVNKRMSIIYFLIVIPIILFNYVNGIFLSFSLGILIAKLSTIIKIKEGEV